MEEWELNPQAGGCSGFTLRLWCCSEDKVTIISLKQGGHLPASGGRVVSKWMGLEGPGHTESS